MRLTRLLSGTLLLGLLFSGCSRSGMGPEGEVSGKVTYNGKPLPGGQVTFITPKGHPFTGIISPDGNYKLRVLVGEARIAVDNRMLGQENAPPRPGPHRVPGLKPPPGKVIAEPQKSSDSTITGTYVPIPNKYYLPDESGLTYTVTTGSQTHDIELSDSR